MDEAVGDHRQRRARVWGAWTVLVPSLALSVHSPAAQEFPPACEARHETIAHEILRLETVALARPDHCSLVGRLDDFIDRVDGAIAAEDAAGDLERLRVALSVAAGEEEYARQQLLSACLLSGVCDCDTRVFKVLGWAESAGVEVRAARSPGHLYLKLGGEDRLRAVNIEPADGSIFCDGTEPFAKRICKSIKRFARKVSDASARRGAFLRGVTRSELLGIAHSNAGARLLRLGHVRPALAQQEIAVRLSPRDPLVNLRHAEALLANGRERMPAARVRVEMALELDPNSPYVHLLLGHFAREGGDRETALELYRRAERLAHTDQSVLVSLGDALRTMGEERASRRAYHTALFLARDRELRESIRARLDAPEPALAGD